MAMGRRSTLVRLQPEVNRIVYVPNLPYKITSDDMYDIFGKYGAIKQIRVEKTKGTAFVVYEDLYDAKNACDHLSGFNVCNRYLVVSYYQANKSFKKVEQQKKQQDLGKIKTKYGLQTPDIR